MLQGRLTLAIVQGTWCTYSFNLSSMKWYLHRFLVLPNSFIQIHHPNKRTRETRRNVCSYLIRICLLRMYARTIPKPPSCFRNCPSSDFSYSWWWSLWEMTIRKSETSLYSHRTSPFICLIPFHNPMRDEGRILMYIQANTNGKSTYQSFLPTLFRPFVVSNLFGLAKVPLAPWRLSN